ncbi:hypothetical protein FH972_019413 [Carpinus fangiana]|uniref:Uncharacterized protein n=1 Tax=Carpinus fangiana TaxID=176857 RepID=A0A5N6RQ72_9ROSI|nr:hypothetical protein FH972_019413 [Carpinus fangiana]
MQKGGRMEIIGREIEIVLVRWEVGMRKSIEREMKKIIAVEEGAMVEIIEMMTEIIGREKQKVRGEKRWMRQVREKEMQLEIAIAIKAEGKSEKMECETLQVKRGTKVRGGGDECMVVSIGGTWGPLPVAGQLDG